MLSYTEICALVEAGCIQGVQEGAINGSSIDLHLGPLLRGEIFPGTNAVLDLVERPSMALTDIVLTEENNKVFLGPGAFVLAQSMEVFNLPADISAEVYLKSSIARMGLEHLHAGHCDPTWHGSNLTLEFKNMLLHHGMLLTLGMPIVQMVFFRSTVAVPEEHSYKLRGRYNLDRGPTEAK